MSREYVIELNIHKLFYIKLTHPSPFSPLLVAAHFHILEGEEQCWQHPAQLFSQLF